MKTGLISFATSVLYQMKYEFSSVVTNDVYHAVWCCKIKRKE